MRSKLNSKSSRRGVRLKAKRCLKIHFEGYLAASRSFRAGSYLEDSDFESHEKAGARVLRGVGLITHGLPSNEAEAGRSSQRPECEE